MFVEFIKTSATQYRGQKPFGLLDSQVNCINEQVKQYSAFEK